MGTKLSKRQPVAAIGNWFYGRLGFKYLTYHVPEHAQSLPYMLGGLALAGFAILIASGIYMAQFYNPNQIASNESVHFLITQVPFGNFARSVHFWAANIIFAIIVIHMIRAFISGSYKRPREFTWLAGLGLLMVTMGFIFTGTMLSLGQEGIEALQHNSEAGLLLGKIGLWFTAGFSRSVPLIGRVYIAHITILGALFVACIVAHFYLIKAHGISPKASKNAEVGRADNEGQSHFNHHLIRLAGWSFILAAVIALLALWRPESLGSPGVAGVEATKPPWMFLWIFGLENLFGIKALVWGSGLLFGVLAIIPFIDRSPYLSPRRRLWVMGLGVIVLLTFVGLTLDAWSTKIEMPADETGVVPSIIERADRLLFPVVYAHNMPSITFSPSVVKQGQTMTVGGDGLMSGQRYDIYLKGPQMTILLGTAEVETGEDMFDADFKIPTSLPADMYTVEMRNQMNPQTEIAATLQLTVQAINPTSAQSSMAPSYEQYSIPGRELPWIVGFICLSFILGVAILKWL